MYVPLKLFALIIFCDDDFVLLEPVKSAEPPISSGINVVIASRQASDDFLVAVGFALAEEINREKFGDKICNHKTYVIAGDGCLMEGISHEAMSLAGHLKLKNLILFFDNNSISIDGNTNLSISDDYKKRFASYNWDLIEINGHDHNQISKAINKAQTAKKPTVISCKTIIGYGSPNKSNTASVHGSPLGSTEIELVRKKLKWSSLPFEVPENILKEWRKLIISGKKHEENWKKNFDKLEKNKKEELLRIKSGNLPKNFNEKIAQIKDKFFENSKPTALAMPCPKGPVVVSIPESFSYSGCPAQIESNCLKFLIFSILIVL